MCVFAWKTYQHLLPFCLTCHRCWQSKNPFGDCPHSTVEGCGVLAFTVKSTVNHLQFIAKHTSSGDVLDLCSVSQKGLLVQTLYQSPICPSTWNYEKLSTHFKKKKMHFNSAHLIILRLLVSIFRPPVVSKVFFTYNGSTYWDPVSWTE